LTARAALLAALAGTGIAIAGSGLPFVARLAEADPAAHDRTCRLAQRRAQ
jgi:hypothetical protein